MLMLTVTGSKSHLRHNKANYKDTYHIQMFYVLFVVQFSMNFVFSCCLLVEIYDIVRIILIICWRFMDIYFSTKYL